VERVRQQQQLHGAPLAAECVQHMPQERGVLPHERVQVVTCRKLPGRRGRFCRAHQPPHACMRKQHTEHFTGPSFEQSCTEHARTACVCSGWRRSTALGDVVQWSRNSALHCMRAQREAEGRTAADVLR
jgi:hypothetical protein